MSMFNRTYLGFTFILLLSAFLRLYALAIVPPSPSLDEVSIGYNAYSILTTGKDEYGYRLPLLLRAYDDWRPSMYVYIVIPFVKFMGLSSLAVRFPSIILSLFAVYLMFCLGKLFSRYNSRLRYLGEAVSFLMAISPWHIYISRLGHEANLGFTLTLAGVYALCVFIIEKKQWYLLWASILFGVSLHGYQSQKLITPILLIAFGAMYWKECVKHIKVVCISAGVFLLIVLPAVYVTVTGEGLSRLKGTSAFSIDAPVYTQAFQALQIAKSSNDIIGKILNTRKVVMARVFASNYFSHFAPTWLFMGSEREAHKVPNMGLLYSWELISVLVGLIYLIVFSSIDFRVLLFLLVWGLSGPLPAAITTQAPHAMRSFTWLPPLALLSGVGVLELWYVARKFTWTRWIIVGGIILWSLMQFGKGYFITFPRTQSDSFQYAMKDTMAFVQGTKNEYKQIVFSNNGNLYQSYMFYLFYSSFDPNLYQILGGSVSGGYDKPHRLKNFEFRSVDWTKEELKAGTLYVSDSKNAPSQKRIVNIFRNLDGKEAIIAFTL